MGDERDTTLAASDLPEMLRKIRARTPARLLVGRVGAAYRTHTQMDLREAHAAARDAVHAEMDAVKILGPDFVQRWGLFEVRTRAARKEEYLLRPELGRHLADASRGQVLNRCRQGCDLQLVIGDGLSVRAIGAQVPALLPLLILGAREKRWTVGPSFVVHYCRVGILNEIGELLSPRVAVLLIGERPGLATAESLSAYMAYRPGASHTDADRNVISNIHARGLSPAEAAARILALAGRMAEKGTSGCLLEEKSQIPEKH
jgi:ethanolamine ammonia-lyase small subunit